MTQPSSSGSQRLTTSPVYFTPLRFELLDQLRILDARGGELLRLLRSSPVGCLQRAADRSARRSSTSATWPLLQQRLELAVGNRPAGRRQEVHLRERQQQQERRARTRATTPAATAELARRRGGRRRAD